MLPFAQLAATACPLGLANVDTDQLIPARFMSRSRTQGYGAYLLHDLRVDADGNSLGFVIDDNRYQGSAILVARRNFGTGSSREAAVYALWDYGIRCVLAPSFGDIFASNAVKNGLLPAVLPEADIEDILQRLADGSVPQLVVDLQAQKVLSDNMSYAFTVDPVRRLQLMNGWDDLDLTLLHADDISTFSRQRKRTVPWSVPERA